MTARWPISPLSPIPPGAALYLHVVEQPGPVSRDDAAAATGVTRALAAHHLDRLVEAGLLDTEYRRLNGRTGPGAGRPSKLYRRTDRELSASVPARHYDLAAELFAEALSGGAGAGSAAAAPSGARGRGGRGSRLRPPPGRRGTAPRRATGLRSAAPRGARGGAA